MTELGILDSNVLITGPLQNKRCPPVSVGFFHSKLNEEEEVKRGMSEASRKRKESNLTRQH
jgi:hypothetical protein